MYDSDYVMVVDVDDDEEDDEEDNVDGYEEDDVVEASGEASLHIVPIYKDSGDESDKEIYDEENDATLEDDNMFMHNVQIPKVPVHVEKRKKQEKPFIPQGHMNDTLPDHNYNSDSFGSPPKYDDERQRPRYPEINAKTNMENPQFEVSMLFAYKKESREAISHYAISKGYEVKVSKNDGKRMQSKCVKCKWNLWDSFLADGTWQIKSMTETYMCSISYSNPQATATFLAKKYLDRIRDEPKMGLRLFQSLIKREIGYEVN
ncbi:hypothetical protein CerSpe_271840 [Prunus speciosa]